MRGSVEEPLLFPLEEPKRTRLEAGKPNSSNNDNDKANDKMDNKNQMESKAADMGPATPVPDELPPRPSAVASTHRERLYNWHSEIAGSVISLCSMVAIIVVLIYYNGKPLDYWHFSLSLNTIVSILSALVRAPLAFAVGSCLAQAKWNWFKSRPDGLSAFERFEEASRGPLGRLGLIMWLHIRHWAVIGAIVTLFLLGFDPFFQAIIRYDGRMDVDELVKPGVATSNSLNAGSYNEVTSALVQIPLPNNNSLGLDTFNSEPGPGLTAHLLLGLQPIEGAESGAPLFDCATSNCTWTPFASLAVCGACNDVSDSLVQKTEFSKDGSAGTLKHDGMMMVDSGNYTSHSLPYVSLTNKNEKAAFKAYKVAGGETNPGNTVSFQHLDTMLLTYGIIASDDYEQGRAEWKDARVTATECALWLCTQAYRFTVTNGTANETVLGTWTDRDPDSYRPSGEGSMPPNDTTFEQFEDYNNHSLYSEGGDFYRTDLRLRIPADEAAAAGLPHDANLSFSVTQRTIGSTIRALKRYLFQEPVTLPLPPTGDLGPFVPIVSDALLASSSSSSEPSGPGPITDQLALSLTRWARNTVRDSAAGVAEKWAVYIQVKWEYITWPVATTLAGCVFVALTIRQTARLQLQPWKSDVVATLAHSIDPEVREKLRAALNPRPDSIVQTAGGAAPRPGKITMRLEGSHGGWELREMRTDR